MQTQNYKLWVYVKIEKYWKLLQPFMDAFLKIKTTIYERRFCIFFVFFMYTLSMAAKRASKSSSVVEHFTCSNGFTLSSK